MTKFIYFRKFFLSELIILVLIKFIVDYEYEYFIVKYFEYMGFSFEFDIFPYFTGWFFYLGTYYILNRRKNLYIYDIYLFIYLVWVLPNIVFYSFHNHDFYFLLLLLLPFILIIVLTFERSLLYIRPFKNGKPIILFSSLFLVLLVIIHYFISTGGKLVFDLSKVYEQREAYEEIASSGIFGYLNSWAFKFFSIILLAWGIYKKKMILVFVFSLFIIILFGFSGHKSALMGLFIVPFFYVIYKYKNVSFLIIFSFFSLLVFVVLLRIFTNNIIFESLIIRRLLMVPAHLNFTYLDFFSNSEHIYWSNSILKVFFQYPYDVSFEKVIGDYLGFPDMAANTGFLASGFAQAGVLGIIIYTFIAIILMNIINTLAKQKEKYFFMSIAFVPLFSMFTSSDMPTALLTHGLLVSMGILYLYSKKTYKIKMGKIKYEI